MAVLNLLASPPMSRGPFSNESIVAPAGAQKPVSPASLLPRRRITSQAMPIQIEPDDAHITGATRSLSRRLLALNIRHDA